jgi:predicted transposase YbfD/YdcC
VDLAGSVGTGRELLDAVDLDNAVVTADAVHAQRETAEYIAGKKEDGNRESDYFLFVIISSLN